MPKLKDFSDNELILLLDNGDKNAFTEIYLRYWDSMLLHARKLLKDDEEIQDVLQQVFTQLWLRESSLSIKVSLSAYLYSSIRNHILNKIVRNKVHENYLSSFATFASNSTDNADFSIREKQLAEKIDQEIEDLPGKMKEVFVLSRKEHLSHKEISERLNISDHTVKKQINNALKILKSRLKNFNLFIEIVLIATVLLN